MSHYKVGLAFRPAEVLWRIYGAVETASLELLLGLGLYGKFVQIFRLKGLCGLYHRICDMFVDWPWRNRAFLMLILMQRQRWHALFILAGIDLSPFILFLDPLDIFLLEVIIG